MHAELSIIQKTYDFIKWYIPILNKLPRDHKFNLGDRIVRQPYDFLKAFPNKVWEREKRIWVWSSLIEQVNKVLHLFSSDYAPA